MEVLENFPVILKKGESIDVYGFTHDKNGYKNQSDKITAQYENIENICSDLIFNKGYQCIMLVLDSKLYGYFIPIGFYKHYQLYIHQLEKLNIIHTFGNFIRFFYFIKK